MKRYPKFSIGFVVVLAVCLYVFAASPLFYWSMANRYDSATDAALWFFHPVFAFQMKQTPARPLLRSWDGIWYEQFASRLPSFTIGVPADASRSGTVP